MSHLITTVNNQTPNVNGAITSNASPFSYFFIGNQYAYNFTQIASSSYPRAIAVNDEYLFQYATNYYYDDIGVTINNFSTGWAESFTIPAGSYLCCWQASVNVAASTNQGASFSLTDGTNQLSGTMSHGRNLNNAATYGDYNNEKIQACTRFTVASSTTIYVNIDTETGTANAPSVGRAFFSLMKEP